MSSELKQQEWGNELRLETDGSVSKYGCRLENQLEDLQLPDTDCGHPRANPGVEKSLDIGNLPLSEMHIRDKPATGVLARVRQSYNLQSDTRLQMFQIDEISLSSPSNRVILRQEQYSDHYDKHCEWGFHKANA